MAADLRNLPPIPKAERAKVKRPEKISATGLGKADTCLRSFWLYTKHKGGPQTHRMASGECWHDFKDRFIGMLCDTATDGDHAVSAPGEVGKDWMNAVISERKDLVLPGHEQHALRGMAWNFAEATVIDPDSILGREQMFELQLGDWVIRGKPDLAYMTPFGYIVIEDDKSGLSIMSRDEAENGAKGHQSWFYPLMLSEGIPEGESLPLGAGVEEFHFRFVFPRFRNEETGELIYREVVRTRDQLHDYKNTLISHLERIDHGFETGEWPASPGSHCSQCPARSECPLPQHVHEFNQIESVAQAEAALALHMTRDHEQRRIMKSVRAFAEEHAEPIIVGDYAYAFRYQESRSVDWDAVNGGPIDPKKHVTVRSSTPFAKRKVTAEEREARAA